MPVRIAGCFCGKFVCFMDPCSYLRHVIGTMIHMTHLVLNEYVYHRLSSSDTGGDRSDEYLMHQIRHPMQRGQGRRCMQLLRSTYIGMVAQDEGIVQIESGVTLPTLPFVKNSAGYHGTTHPC